MKRLLFFIYSLAVTTHAMAQESYVPFSASLDAPHHQSLSERLGDGPFFMFATICAGFWLFIIGAIAYVLFRKRYWPTAEQKAHAAWLAATAPEALRKSDSKKTSHWHQQALAALTQLDRDAVSKILDDSGATIRPTTWKLFYKKRESLAWVWLYPVMYSLVLWAGYKLIWLREFWTLLWWAELMIFVSFTTVLGVLPIVLVREEILSRRRGDPAWLVNTCGIKIGSNMYAWPQTEEIWPHVVLRNKQVPTSLVLFKRWGEKEEKMERFPNIEPDNIRIFVHHEPADLSEAQTEIVLPSKELAGAAKLAALLRYRQHYARIAFPAEWKSYSDAVVKAK